jgi:MFS family permease
VQPDEPTNGAGRPDGRIPAGSDGVPVGSSGRPPGIRDQLGATFQAGKRLLRAHVDLAKAEAGEILDEVKRMVALAAVAFGLLFVTGLLLTIGLVLFLGDWLFGSIGWGVLLGTFLFLDLALMALLLALAVSGARLGSSLGLAAVIGVVVGVVLGFDLAHRGWTSLGDSIAPTVDPSNRALIVAVVALAILGGILGLVGGLRRGGGASIGGLVGGAILGALVGLVSSVAIPGTVGAALGVWVTLIAWPVLAGRDLLRTGIDGEAIKQRFMPDQTIELTKETIEWARARTPLAPKS